MPPLTVTRVEVDEAMVKLRNALGEAIAAQGATDVEAGP
jgi:hypothetical protein